METYALDALAAGQYAGNSPVFDIVKNPLWQAETLPGALANQGVDNA